MLFEGKLEELEASETQLKQQMLLCESNRIESIETELLNMKQKRRDQEDILLNQVHHTGKPILKRLALCQLSYCDKMDDILNQQLASCHLDESEQLETMALYAEYAIDFAKLATDYALMAAMMTKCMELEKEEQSNARD